MRQPGAFCLKKLRLPCFSSQWQIRQSNNLRKWLYKRIVLIAGFTLSLK